MATTEVMRLNDDIRKIHYRYWLNRRVKTIQKQFKDLISAVIGVDCTTVVIPYLVYDSINDFIQSLTQKGFIQSFYALPYIPMVDLKQPLETTQFTGQMHDIAAYFIQCCKDYWRQHKVDIAAESLIRQDLHQKFLTHIIQAYTQHETPSEDLCNQLYLNEQDSTFLRDLYELL